MKKIVLLPSLILSLSLSQTTFAGLTEDLSSSLKEGAVNAISSGDVSSSDITKSVSKTMKSSASQSLIDMVSTKAGVTPEQATGGLGAIFKTAKNSLSKDDFGSIAKAVPNMDSLLAAAPAKSDDSGLVGGLLAGAGKAGELLGLFDTLGLSPDQVSTFTSIIQQYFTSENKPELSELLMQGIGSFL